MDFFTFFFLPIGLSLDDFALAFALSLAISPRTHKDRIMQASKMALAFSLSTGILPLLGWLISMILFNLIAPISALAVLIVFCGVGLWILKESFDNEQANWTKKNTQSFLVLLLMGVIGSLDEMAIGIGYPFLEIPVLWIILAVIFTNMILVFLAAFLSIRVKKWNRRMPLALSGSILVMLGIINCLKILQESQ